MKLRFFFTLVFIATPSQAAQSSNILDDWVLDDFPNSPSTESTPPRSPQPKSTVTELVTMPPRPVTPPLTDTPEPLPVPPTLINPPLLPPTPRSDDPIILHNSPTDSSRTLATAPPLTLVTTNRLSSQSPTPSPITPLSPKKQSVQDDHASTHNNGWFSRCCGCLCIMNHVPKKGS